MLDLQYFGVIIYFGWQTSEGIRNTPEFCLAAIGQAAAAAVRVRLPRRWDSGHVVTRFDPAAAAAAAVLLRLAREQVSISFCSSQFPFITTLCISIFIRLGQFEQIGAACWLHWTFYLDNHESILSPDFADIYAVQNMYSLAHSTCKNM